MNPYQLQKKIEAAQNMDEDMSELYEQSRIWKEAKLKKTGWTFLSHTLDGRNSSIWAHPTDRCTYILISVAGAFCITTDHNSKAYWFTDEIIFHQIIKRLCPPELNP